MRGSGILGLRGSETYFGFSVPGLGFRSAGLGSRFRVGGLKGFGSKVCMGCQVEVLGAQGLFGLSVLGLGFRA